MTGFDATLWLGLPAAAVSWLNDVYTALPKSSDFQQQFCKVGAEVAYRLPQDWNGFPKFECEKRASVARATGAHVN